MLEYFMAICNILRPFGLFYGHFSSLVVTGYIFLHFGILFQEKSGNPGHPPPQWSLAQDATVKKSRFCSTELCPKPGSTKLKINLISISF
jgi:hypothetical protein